MRISPASALILLLFLPVACSNADSLARSYATRDSSGVEIVSNGGARCTPDNTWILDLHSTFGEVDGQLAFGYIESMALAPNGELFVLDDLNKRILVFGPEGRFLATFGRAGDGPGEFRFPRHVGVLGEDLIAVGDGAPSRLHVLTGRGDFVRQIRVEPPADAAVTGLANVVADWKVVPGTGVWAALRMYSGTGEDSVPVRLVRFSESGEVADTVLRWNLPGDSHRYELWKSQWQWSIGEDGTVVTSPGHSHEVRFLLPSGPRIVARRDVEAVGVTPDLKEKLLELYFASMERSGESSAMVGQARGLAEIATPFPATAGIHVATPSGRAWVRSVDPRGDDTSATTSVHHIYAPTGEYLGCAHNPLRFRLMLVTDSLVFGRWLDDLDVPFVRSYSVIPPRSVAARDDA